MQWIVKQTKSKGYEFTFDIMKDDAVIGQAHYIPKMLRQGYKNQPGKPTTSVVG